MIMLSKIYVNEFFLMLTMAHQNVFEEIAQLGELTQYKCKNVCLMLQECVVYINCQGISFDREMKQIFCEGSYKPLP